MAMTATSPIRPPRRCLCRRCPRRRRPLRPRMPPCRMQIAHPSLDDIRANGTDHGAPSPRAPVPSASPSTSTGKSPDASPAVPSPKQGAPASPTSTSVAKKAPGTGTAATPAKTNALASRISNLNAAFSQIKTTPSSGLTSEPIQSSSPQLATRHQHDSPSLSDSVSSSLEEVSLSGSGRLQSLKKATVSGRRKASKNALANKSSMERRSLELKEAEGASPTPTKKAGAGGMGLLASVGMPAQALRKTQSAFLPSSSQGSPSGSAPSSPAPVSKSTEGIKAYLEDPNLPKLIQIKGRRKVKVRLVELSHRSLNEADVYILDLFNKLIVWNGVKANRMERAKAVDVATRIKDKDRNTRAVVVALEQAQDGPGKKDHDEFWNAIGGRAKVAPEDTGVDDEAYDQLEDYTLYKLEDKGGQVVPVLLTRRPAKENLDTQFVFLMDCISEYYIWQGKTAPASLKNAAAQIARQQLVAGFDEKIRPAWTKITKLTEGTENVLFKEKFSNWPDKLPIAMQAAPLKSNVAVVKDEKVDVAALSKYNPPTEKIVDDAQGKLQVWHVTDFGKREVEPAHHGLFFSSESYVVLYTYYVGHAKKECFIIYFWQGCDCSSSDKGTSAYMTVDLDDKIGGAATQVRVVQNQEPSHFLMLFPKGLVVMKGNMVHEDDWLTPPKVTTPDGPDPNGLTLFHVRGRAETRVGHAVQVAVSPYAINSLDSFVLCMPGRVLVRHATPSIESTRSTAMLVARRLQKGGDITEMVEGKETPIFWETLAKFAPSGALKFPVVVPVPSRPPRLFHCTNSSGRFRALEVFPFVLTQDDLVDGDMMMLELAPLLYVWGGSTANQDEKKATLDLAKEWAALNANKPVYFVESGQEPVSFIHAFHGWDASRCRVPPAVAEGKMQLLDTVYKAYTRTYTLDELKAKPKELDQTNLEFYLSDADFMKHFSVTKDEFKAMTVWKRTTEKKRVGLY
eukprot:TRINITY_DN7008_c0_g1_i5.p1 TRINITY_DN7008_c0_g1~~TRINITY_DN7008_c0_g1_i5.p1  ORF type:complete len:964 (+),score=336.88 TRINITY_DN7008_c0_g1_i5:2048-4939(+)